MYDKIDKGKHTKKNNVELEPKKDEKDKAKTEKKKKNKNKDIQIQQLNVEVKSNELKFREHYYQEIKPFLEKLSLEGDR